MVTHAPPARRKAARDVAMSPSPAGLDAAGVLRAAGLRATGPRLALLRTLQTRHHATVEELAGDVADQGVVLSTVYRTLEHLERVGVVGQVNLTPDRRSYHLVATAHHLHLRCTRCERLSDANTALLTRFATKIKDATGFALDTQHPVLTGVCARCQQR